MEKRPLGRSDDEKDKKVCPKGGESSNEDLMKKRTYGVRWQTSGSTAVAVAARRTTTRVTAVGVSKHKDEARTRTVAAARVTGERGGEGAMVVVEKKEGDVALAMFAPLHLSRTGLGTCVHFLLSLSSSTTVLFPVLFVSCSMQP
jgi:hypothetical protein